MSLAFVFLGCSSNGSSGGGADTGGSNATGGGSPSSGGAGPAGTGGASSATGGANGGSQGGAGGAAGGATGGSSATGGSNASGGAAGGGAGGASVADASVTPDAVAPSSDAASRDGASTEAATVAPPFTASYHVGADITWVQHDEMYGATYVDTDGVAKDILTVLKNHGFNSVRMRIYVDPKATDGYDKVDGFGDLAHTVLMGQRLKQAGMGFYLAMHYSDNWADPGKQCVPVAWQGDTTLAQLQTHVHDYTLNVMSTLKAAGAMPNLVQVGNEITPGMLIHLCDANGIPITTGNNINPVNGRANNAAGWVNLGNLLKSAIQAIKEVDTTVKIVLHIDKGNNLATSVSWIQNAMAQNVPFDVFADTSYVRWQPQPADWRNTFTMLATMFPTLSFVIPEYGNETATNPPTPSTMRIANDLIFGLPNNRGIGTWFYEPEHPGQAGIGIGLVQTNRTDAGISDPWPVFTMLPDAMTIYDQMKTAYSGRL